VRLVFQASTGTEQGFVAMEGMFEEDKASK
jgi:hypothetical protein